MDKSKDERDKEKDILKLLAEVEKCEERIKRREEQNAEDMEKIRSLRLAVHALIAGPPGNGEMPTIQRLEVRPTGKANFKIVLIDDRLPFSLSCKLANLLLLLAFDGGPPARSRTAADRRLVRFKTFHELLEGCRRNGDRCSAGVLRTKIWLIRNELSANSFARELIERDPLTGGYRLRILRTPRPGDDDQ